MSGETLSREPVKSNTEQLRTQLTGEHIREQIFDVLKANPETRFTYSELGTVLDKDYQGIRRQLLKMEDNEYRVNGEQFMGIVESEQDGRSLKWQLRDSVRSELDEPTVHEVTVEQTRYPDLWSFLYLHQDLAAMFLLLFSIGGFITLVGQFLLLPYENVFGVMMIGGLLAFAGLLIVGIREVD